MILTTIPSPSANTGVVQLLTTDYFQLQEGQKLDEVSSHNNTMNKNNQSENTFDGGGAAWSSWISREKCANDIVSELMKKESCERREYERRIPVVTKLF
jgi:hypothetical protein